MLKTKGKSQISRPARFMYVCVIALGAIGGVLWANPSGGQTQDSAPSSDEVSHRVSQPIEVTADRLDVQQEQNVATFSGNVEAIQGSLTLNAEAIKVYYRDPASSEPSDPEALVISRIDASGNVTLTLPNESVQGSWAIYDVDRELITVGGQVKLTRGETILSGERLELDLTTGRSTLVSSNIDDESQRVRGVFSPPENSR